MNSPGGKIRLSSIPFYQPFFAMVRRSIVSMSVAELAGPGILYYIYLLGTSLSKYCNKRVAQASLSCFGSKFDCAVIGP